MIDEIAYRMFRSQLLSDYHARILGVEQEYTSLLTQVTLSAAKEIQKDFSDSFELKPFWFNYAPRQRGRLPTGTAIPWGELGEKTIITRIIRSLIQEKPCVHHPGLPIGGDFRFATEDALVHFDVKLTGPNDNPNEIVASSYQISGDGNTWNDGVLNTSFQVEGKRSSMVFQPQLAPFYVLQGTVLVCLTFFLKAVYTVHDLGNQPITHLELVCIPNGLLLFDGPKYALVQGLLIPGKDDKTIKREKRVRVRLDPLATIAKWRCTRIVLVKEEWQVLYRGSSRDS